LYPDRDFRPLPNNHLPASQVVLQTSGPMDMQALFAFLEELQQNNHKEWMDENRSRYKQLREAFIDFLDGLNQRIKAVDPGYLGMPGREAMNRINNNLLYHPNKPTYKDHFSADLEGAKNASTFYVHIGLSGNFVGGGFYRPPNAILKKIRAAIDYDGERLREIVEAPDFKSIFGGLMEAEQLKTAPQGYTQDHRHIDLLRLKSFATARTFSRSDAMAKNFMDQLVRTYEYMKPFRDYLNQAVQMEAQI
jgi:uncharacterized protein (TIGR02453 family)